MTETDFIPLALRTEAPDIELADAWAAQTRNSRPGTADHSWNNPTRLLHASMGLSTETYEIEFEVVGPESYNGSMLEEVGDLLWYCAVARDCLPPRDGEFAYGAKLSPEARKEVDEMFDPNYDWGGTRDEDYWLWRLRMDVGRFAEFVKPVAFYNRLVTKKGTPVAYILHQLITRIHEDASELLKQTEDKTLEEARERVVEKLRTRFPDKFSEDDANARADKEAATA